MGRSEPGGLTGAFHESPVDGGAGEASTADHALEVASLGGLQWLTELQWPLGPALSFSLRRGSRLTAPALACSVSSSGQELLPTASLSHTASRPSWAGPAVLGSEHRGQPRQVSRGQGILWRD